MGFRDWLLSIYASVTSDAGFGELCQELIKVKNKNNRQYYYSFSIERVMYMYNNTAYII